MATYAITINERTKEGRQLAAALAKSKAVVSFSGGKRLSGLTEALDDLRKGRVFEAKDGADLVRKCLS